MLGKFYFVWGLQCSVWLALWGYEMVPFCVQPCICTYHAYFSDPANFEATHAWYPSFSAPAPIDVCPLCLGHIAYSFPKQPRNAPAATEP